MARITPEMKAADDRIEGLKSQIKAINDRLADDDALKEAIKSRDKASADVAKCRAKVEALKARR